MAVHSAARAAAAAVRTVRPAAAVRAAVAVRTVRPAAAVRAAVAVRTVRPAAAVRTAVPAEAVRYAAAQLLRVAASVPVARHLPHAEQVSAVGLLPHAEQVSAAAARRHREEPVLVQLRLPATAVQAREPSPAVRQMQVATIVGMHVPVAPAAMCPRLPAPYIRPHTSTTPGTAMWSTATPSIGIPSPRVLGTGLASGTIATAIGMTIT